MDAGSRATQGAVAYRGVGEGRKFGTEALPRLGGGVYLNSPL